MQSESGYLLPGSKLSSYKDSKKFMEALNFELQHIYRALDAIAEESDLIQSTLYKNSLALSARNTKVLYCDCTNFFFEIEDGDGVPLAFSITPGNTNEQKTLKSLEEQILHGESKIQRHPEKRIQDKAVYLWADGFISTYTRTDFADDLHEAFGFRTDHEIVTTKQIKRFLPSGQRYSIIQKWLK